MIGEMQEVSGHVKFSGKLAYGQQNAWIQSVSIRENVLFGLPWDEERYHQAVSDAALDADLLLFPAGDMTEVGEKG